MPAEPLIWALTDGRPGSDNQTIAVAEKLGNYQNHRIEFGPAADLPNFLLSTSDLGILTKLEKPWPDLIIAAGRRLARVSRMIKKDSPTTKLIQLMWPGTGAKDFNLIFAPEHDNLKPRANLITTIGAPNLMTQEVLKASAEKWQHRIPIERPAIAMLVGNIKLDECQKLINMVNNLTGYLMITTSRRTNPEITEALETNIHHQRYFHKWSSTAENPYLGFIALADFVIVTEDSTSMISEALTAGKPTYIFSCDTNEKHKRFSASLINSNKACLFNGENLQTYNYQPLNTLQMITQTIRAKIIDQS